MKKDFQSLLGTILEYKLDFSRINDVTISDEIYSIGFSDYKNAQGVLETHLCLRDSKRKEYGITEYQLAALRIATGPVSIKWLDEFRTAANCVIFQTLVDDVVTKVKTLEFVKFKVVAQLKIRNQADPTGVTPVYHERCYEGAADFMKATRLLVKDKPRDFYTTSEYRNGIKDLRDALYATKVKEGKAIDANAVLLPVFECIY